MFLRLLNIDYSKGFMNSSYRLQNRGASSTIGVKLTVYCFYKNNYFAYDISKDMLAC